MPIRRPEILGGRALASGHLAALGKHSTILFVANALSRGVSFLLLPLYTGVLLVEEYNHFEALVLVSQLVGYVAAHGLTAAMMWTLKTGGALAEGELDEARQERVVAGCVGWAWTAAVVVCGVTVLAAGPLAEVVTRRPDLDVALALLVVGQGLRIVTYPVEGVLKLRFRTGAIVAMSLGEFAVQLVVTVVALRVLGLHVVGLAWATFLGAVLRVILAWIVLPEMRRPRLDFVLVAPLVRYGLPLMPGAIAAQLLSLSDRWFFNWYGLAEQGGMYAYADKFARIVEFLLVTPLVAMWPAVYFNIAREPDAPARFARAATLFAGLAGTVAFGLTVLGPPLARLLDTSDDAAFSRVVGPIGVLTVGYVLFGLNEVARVGFALTARTRRTAVVMVTAAGLNLGLNAVVIPRFGADGAAWSTTLSYGTTVALSLWLSRRVYPQAWEWRRLLHVAALYVGGAWVVSALVPDDGVALRVAAALGGPLVLLATGFLTADERRAALSWIGARRQASR